MGERIATIQTVRYFLLRSEKQQTTDMALRDPLILDFLGLKDTYDHSIGYTILSQKTF